LTRRVFVPILPPWLAVAHEYTHARVEIKHRRSRYRSATDAVCSPAVDHETRDAFEVAQIAGE
jgi:hypothetical protein